MLDLFSFKIQMNISMHHKSKCPILNNICMYVVFQKKTFLMCHTYFITKTQSTPHMTIYEFDVFFIFMYASELKPYVYHFVICLLSFCCTEAGMLYIRRHTKTEYLTCCVNRSSQVQQTLHINLLMFHKQSCALMQAYPAPV